MRLSAPVPVLLVFTLLNLSSPAALPARARGFDSSLTSARVERFLSEHPSDDSSILDSSLEMDLEYRSKEDGYFGQISYVEEYFLRTRDGVKFRQYHSIFESPRLKLDELRIDVLHSTGKMKTYRRGDLEWISRTEREGDVYILDAKNSYALIPHLEPGDRLRLVTRYRVEGLTGIPSFTFGGLDQSVLHSRLDLRLPPNQELVFHLRGSQELRSGLSYENDAPGRHSWELRDIPAGVQEKLAGGVLADRLEWLAKVARIGKPLPSTAFAAGPDWKSVGRAYYERIATALDPTAELLAVSKELTRELADPGTKTDAIYLYVQTHCRYLGLFKGLEGVLPRPASATHRDGFGDCKGLGAYLIALLRGAGIEAYPVLLKTADAGAVDPLVPSISQFNHFIVWAAVGKGGTWLDATVDACRAGVVPPVDAGSPVLFLKPGEEGLRRIPFESWQPGLDRIVARGSISWEGELRLRVIDTMRDNSASAVRISLRNRSGHLDKDSYLAALFASDLKLGADSISYENAEDRHASLRVLLDCHCKAPLAHTTRRIFLPRKLTNAPVLRLDLADRLSPVDLRRRENREFEWHIQLPAGLALARGESLAIAGPGIRWTRAISQQGDSLLIFEHYDWDNVMIPADRADSLSSTFDDILHAEDGFYELGIQ